MKAEPPTVVITPDGFTVGATAVAWDAVLEIRGYKVDLITTDEVFLEFVFDGQVIVGEDQIVI